MKETKSKEVGSTAGAVNVKSGHVEPVHQDVILEEPSAYHQDQNDQSGADENAEKKEENNEEEKQEQN